MGEWITIGKAEDIEDGQAKAYMVGDVEIAIARSEGSLYAFSDLCTHRQCNLSMGGKIEGSTILCECHMGRFDMATGEAIEGPPEDPIDIYQVTDEDGELRVEV